MSNTARARRAAQTHTGPIETTDTAPPFCGEMRSAPSARAHHKPPSQENIAGRSTRPHPRGRPQPRSTLENLFVFLFFHKSPCLLPLYSLSPLHYPFAVLWNFPFLFFLLKNIIVFKIFCLFVFKIFFLFHPFFLNEFLNFVFDIFNCFAYHSILAIAIPDYTEIFQIHSFIFAFLFFFLSFFTLFSIPSFSFLFFSFFFPFFYSPFFHFLFSPSKLNC